MPTIDWPEALIPQTAQLSLRKAGAQFASPFNGTTQAVDFLAERWTLSASLAQMSARNPRGVDAFCNLLAGGVERVRVWPFHTGGVPRGTLRGAPTLAQSVSRGATVLTVTNALAGTNLIRRAVAFNVWGVTGWTTVNATVAGGEIGPDGALSAERVSRTAVGNHGVYGTLTTTAHANRAATFSCWVKRGTLTGTVTLRLRDGAQNEVAAVSINPTTDWQLYQVAGKFGATPAANITGHVDPDNNTGTVGDTYFTHSGRIELMEGSFVNCATEVDNVLGPPGFEPLGMRLLSLGAGDTFWTGTAYGSFAAGDTYTASVWLRAGTLAGQVGVAIFSQAGLVATNLFTPTSTWQRFSITAALPAASSEVTIMVNPLADATAAGQSLEWFGPQIERGGAASTHVPRANLMAGDMIGVGGQLFQVAADTGNAYPDGWLQIPVINRARGTIALGSPVTWYRPTCEMMLPAMQAGPVRRPGAIESTALDLVEVW
jgi:hypothetical protein